MEVQTVPIKLPDNKVIITVAQTGALVNKQMNPNVPEQPDEIIKSTYECYNEGAAVVHIHARDKAGENTSDPSIFRAIKNGIREKSDIVIQFSTGGGPNLTQEQRIECLQAEPELASLNMGSLMRVSGKYAGVPWSNMPHEIEMYVGRMKEKGIKPELEIYDFAMFRDVENIINKGLIEKPYYINLVLGMKYQGACEATPRIFHMMQDFPAPGRDLQLHGGGWSPASTGRHVHDHGRLRPGRPGGQHLLQEGRIGHQRPTRGPHGPHCPRTGQGTVHTRGSPEVPGHSALEKVIPANALGTGRNHGGRGMPRP